MARTPTGSSRDSNGGGTERLQKVLAARGVASRRAAEEMIQAGRVSVDGRVIVEYGAKVDPERSVIKVDGRALRRPRATYLLLNKPRGYVTTASDPEGRRTVFDLVDVPERVFPVGRLDMDSEGLLLLTNDGELANRIAHPRYRIDKEYHALVEGTPPPGALEHLRRGGLPIEGRRTGPADITLIGQEEGGTWLRVVIHEGRKRQVRRMLEEIGHPVRRLRRVRLGPLTLAGLPPASYRPLTAPELARLRRLLGLAPGEVAPVDEPPGPRGPASAGGPARAPGGGAGRAETRELGAGRPRAGRERPRGGPARAERDRRGGRKPPGSGSRATRGTGAKQGGARGGAGGRSRGGGSGRGGTGGRGADGGARPARRGGAAPDHRD